MSLAFQSITGTVCLSILFTLATIADYGVPDSDNEKL